MANEGDIVGFAVISGTRIILPVEVATIDPGAQIPAIATIGTIQFANISIGTVDVGTVSLVLEAGTIGTILSGNVTATISGGIVAVGTIGTIQAGNVTATISSGQLSNVGTIGTIQAGNVTATISGGILQDVGTVGTVIAGYVSADRIWKQTNIVTSPFTGSFIGTSVATLLAENLQDAVIDTVYGTVLAGSIQTSVVGVEPQTGIKTSTIVAGAWFAGTIVTGQRLVAAGPLGIEIAVIVATTGTVQGVWVTAEQSAGP